MRPRFLSFFLFFCVVVIAQFLGSFHDPCRILCHSYALVSPVPRRDSPGIAGGERRRARARRWDAAHLSVDLASCGPVEFRWSSGILVLPPAATCFRLLPAASGSHFCFPYHLAPYRVVCVDVCACVFVADLIIERSLGRRYQLQTSGSLPIDSWNYNCFPYPIFIVLDWVIFIGWFDDELRLPIEYWRDGMTGSFLRMCYHTGADQVRICVDYQFPWWIVAKLGSSLSWIHQSDYCIELN